MEKIIQYIVKRGWLLALLLLSTCNLGDFDPVDIFSQEPLAEDAVALETANNCGFTLLVNNERIIQSNTAAEIKGSLYADINGNTVYLASGEFEAVTDVEGRVSALEGFAKAPLFQTDYFETSVTENEIATNISLVTNGLPSVFNSLSLDETNCFLKYRASEDTAQVFSGDGTIKYKEFYVDPISQFTLLNGNIEVAALTSESGWLAIDPESGFAFDAANSSEDFTFDTFDGNVYTEGSLPITIDSIFFKAVGDIVIDGALENGGLRNFFNASSGNLELGSNGTIEVSYVLIDRLLENLDFYAASDANRTNEVLALTSASASARRNNGVERLSFYGELQDATDIYIELFPGHAAISFVNSVPGSSAIVSGEYTEGENNRVVTVQHSAVLDLKDKGSYEFRDTELTITTDNIALSGIFTSTFNTLPDIFISGTLEGNGDMLLSGQSLFAVNFDGTTLPVTFSISIELIDGEVSLNVSGLAEYCEGNDCNFLPVIATADFDREILQLCVDIPNRGEICIE